MHNLAIANVEREPQQLPATLDKIESAIAIAKTPEEINGVLALMDAAVAYAKRFYKDQQDVINRAKALRLQAERRLGELLRAMPKQAGARGVGKSGVTICDSTPTLSDIGIDKHIASRAQRLAALPEKKFAAVMAGEIPVAKAIATPAKKQTVKTREQEHVFEQKAVLIDEGSSYLITTMRSAFNAVESCGEEVEEREKAVAMAKKLIDSLAKFVSKFN